MSSPTKDEKPEGETSDGAALKARLTAMPDDKMSALWEALKGLIDAPDAPAPVENKLIAYVRHDDGSRTPVTPKQWAQAVLAHPKVAPAESELHSLPRTAQERRIARFAYRRGVGEAERGMLGHPTLTPYEEETEEGT